MKKHILAVAILGSLSVPALASGFFVYGDVGQSHFEIDSESDDKTGYSVGAGYKFNRIFAFELAYRHLGEWEESINDLELYGGTYYDATIDLDASALQASMTASWPLNDAVNLYARAGIAQLKVKMDVAVRSGSISASESGSETRNRGVFGVGLSYDITPSLSLRGEYSQYAKINDLKVSTLNLGVAYRF